MGLVEIEIYNTKYRCHSVGVKYINDKLQPKNLQDGDEIIIKDNDISIEFDYPLSTTVKIKFESKSGFTRMELLKCIYKGYKQIYDEEEKDVGDPGKIPGMGNRQESKGRHGIRYLLIAEMKSKLTEHKDVSVNCIGCALYFSGVIDDLKFISPDKCMKFIYAYFKEISYEDIIPGDILVIKDDDYFWAEHFAIFIGDNLYFQKEGCGGVYSIVPLSDIIKIDSRHFRHYRKKNKSIIIFPFSYY